MGIRGSNTVPLEFDGVPRARRARCSASENGGFKIAMMALDGGRIGISAQAIGIARAALEESVALREGPRSSSACRSASYQAIQWKLADMQTELDAAHLLCMRAAWLKEARAALLARGVDGEALRERGGGPRSATSAVQIHGGYGYMREFAAERHLRDARVTTIYEGTSEIQRIVIARSTLQG